MRYFDERQTDILNVANNQHALKEKNLHDAFSIVNYNQGISRIGISKSTGLTPTTITSLVDELLKRNLIREAGQGVSGPAGRRPIMLETNPDGIQIPVFRFCTSGIQYRLYNLKFEELESDFMAFQQVWAPPTNSSQKVEYREIDGEEFTDIMFKLAMERSQRLEIEKVPAMCIVMPGTFEWNLERFSSSPMRVRGSTRFISRFRERMNGIPLLVGNESDYFAYAQYTGMNDQTQNMVFLNVGTGVGAGAIINGDVYTGVNDLAAEFGHISIDMNGKHCFCGNRGCVERYVCQSAIISRVWEAACEAGQSCIMGRVDGNFNKLTWEVVCEAYRSGDALVCDLIEQKVIRELCFAISNLTCSFDISQIVVGGGIEELGDRFLQKLRAAIQTIGFRKSMKKLNVRYPDPNAGDACVGAAKRFVDKYMMISLGD